MKWGDLDLVRKDADLARDYERGAGAASTPRGVLYSANVSRWHWAWAATHVLAYLLTPPPKTPGQVAYEGHLRASGFGCYGLRWQALSERKRAYWEELAAAVLEHARKEADGG